MLRHSLEWREEDICLLHIVVLNMKFFACLQAQGQGIEHHNVQQTNIFLPSLQGGRYSLQLRNRFPLSLQGVIPTESHILLLTKSFFIKCG